jgi:SET domain-containing protein
LGWTVDVDFKRSGVHGTGVFARSPIAAGTRIWEFDPSMHVCDREAMYALPPRKLRFALHGGYYHKPSGLFLWYTDGMQYMNHATSPLANIGLSTWPPLQQDHTVALRDIEAGEELFEDYTFWSDGGLSPDHWLHKLYCDHCPEHYAFLLSLEAFRIAA